MYKNITTIILLLGLTLSGCEAKTSPHEEVKALVKSLLKEMVYVKGGSFTRGCVTEKEELMKYLPQNIKDYMYPKTGKKPDFQFWGYGNCWPRHKVTLDGFNLAKFETSWKEFDLYTKIEKLPTVQPNDKKRKYVRRLPEKAANLGWHQADRYCKWLAKVSGLPFGLPTEAQWEYAATDRGKFIPYGTDTGYWEEGVNIPTYEEKKEMAAKETKYPPNPLGIYHLADSMAEWTSDWYAPYTKEPKTNPKGPKTGTGKIIKGFGGISGPNWDRGESRIILTDRQIKRRKNIFHMASTKEDADRMVDGVRCALHLDRAITQKDIDAVK